MLINSVNNETSRKIRRSLSRMGMNVRLSANARPMDFTNRKCTDPVAAIYESGTRSVILRVLLKECIFFRHLALPCVAYGPSPQVQTLKAYSEGHCGGYEGSPLDTFYTRFTPNCAAELMGLINPSHAVFNELSPAASLLPWRPHTPCKALHLQQRTSASEIRQHSATSNDVRGNQFFGPVSTSKGKLEFQRLISVYETIRQHGFLTDREGFSNIFAVCLIDDRHGPHTLRTRFFISSGQHRIAALVALNTDYVNLQIRPEGPGGLIRRSDAKYWPTVQMGYFTASEAIWLFDRLFEARQPACFNVSMSQEQALMTR